MADAGLDPLQLRVEKMALDYMAQALRDHELRQRLALSLRAMRRILRALDRVSFEPGALPDVQPSLVLGAIANIVDQATPAAAGLDGFHRIRWQLSRQSHRSRRRTPLEQLAAGADLQE